LCATFLRLQKSIIIVSNPFHKERSLSPKSQELTDCPASPKFLLTTRESGVECHVQPTPEWRSCARFLSPISIAFMGLITAIVLWGTAYKLSLYHPHVAPGSPTQVAKLWLETRTSYVVSIAKIKGRSSHTFCLQDFTAPNRLLLGLPRVPGFPDDLHERQILRFALPRASRSPPLFASA
jgi:hypothetical protein